MDWSLIVSGVALVLNAVVIGFWKPWIGAYGGEKGKNLARKEDLDVILAELRASTTVQKGIETQLAGDLWNRQTLRNDKRAIYGDLLVKIHEATKACQNLIHWREHLAQPLHWTPNADMGALEPTIKKEFADYHAAQTELIRLAALMQVFGRKESGEQLIAYLKTNRRLELNSAVEPIKEQRNRLIGLSDEMVASAKVDLGISTRDPSLTLL